MHVFMHMEVLTMLMALYDIGQHFQMQPIMDVMQLQLQ